MLRLSIIQANSTGQHDSPNYIMHGMLRHTQLQNVLYSVTSSHMRRNLLRKGYCNAALLNGTILTSSVIST